jgi:oxalate decarboxylase/phosphoglucose isomerase-like protein (cupin superfamily)
VVSLMADIPQRSDVDAAGFRETILPGGVPVVLRGLVRDWPAVREAQRSPQAVAAYVSGHDRGQPVETFIGPPAIEGRFFYDPSLRGFNFERRAETLAQFFARLLSHFDDTAPPAIYAGALDLTSHLPAMAAENRLALVDARVPPRIWIGNAVEISTHHDHSHNIACVVAGRRRFTLFPPDQVANLYIGPLEFTIAGQPVSMASLDYPDFAAHPRFEEALSHAVVAELEPGDAIYIPPLWWHHVRSLAPLNVLVNYWWEEASAAAGPAFHALVHGLLAIRHLPEPQRRAWRAMFDHYVFQLGDDPAAHLRPENRGVLAPMTPELARVMRAFLVKGLSGG